MLALLEEPLKKSGSSALSENNRTTERFWNTLCFKKKKKQREFSFKALFLFHKKQHSRCVSEEPKETTERLFKAAKETTERFWNTRVLETQRVFFGVLLCFRRRRATEQEEEATNNTSSLVFSSLNNTSFLLFWTTPSCSNKIQKERLVLLRID